MKAAKTNPTKKYFSQHPNGLRHEVGQVDSKTGMRVGFWRVFNEYGRLEGQGVYKDGKKDGLWTEIAWKRGTVFEIEYTNGSVKSRSHKQTLSDKNLSDLDQLLESYRQMAQKLFLITPTNIGAS